jgi:hypothetical protein
MFKFDVVIVVFAVEKLIKNDAMLVVAMLCDYWLLWWLLLIEPWLLLL